MAAVPDHESLAERTKRALEYNPTAEQLAAVTPIYGAQVGQAAYQAAQGAQAGQGGPAGPAAFEAAQVAYQLHQAAEATQPSTVPEPTSNAGHFTDRLRAIALVRELEPRRACYADRVKDLSRQLTHLPEHSVHFRTVLDRLREAHSEWQVLEEQLQGAQYVIRSTQWLVDLLADPYSGFREVASGESQ